ncbi:MAG: hypothetical protein HY594_05000, partial [Candidatus Omnitrophica bacterium]|nr:hypothetical protein [Candidatus Omnitrophota bacterium]
MENFLLGVPATIVLCAAFGLTQTTLTWSQEENFDSAAQRPGDVRAVASRGTQPRVTKTAQGAVSMDLVDAALEDVLKLLSQQAGLNFVAAQAVRDKRVTVYMDRVPLQTAIRSLLDANNLTFHPMEGSDVFIVTDSGGRSIKLVTKVYPLKFARVLPTVSEAASKFGATGSLIQTAFSGTSSSGGGAAGSQGGGSGVGSGGGGGGESGTHEDRGLVNIIKQLITER